MESNFDLGVELAGLLSTASGAIGEQPSYEGYSSFEQYIAALRPYLSAEQDARLNRAMELAEMIRSVKQLLPRLGGALGVR